MLHLLVLTLKTSHNPTGATRGELLNPWSSYVDTQRSDEYSELTPTTEGRQFYSCLRCCSTSTDTPSCFTKLAVCSRIQARLGFSKCASSWVLQHSEGEQSFPLGLLSEFLLNSALFSQSLSSLASSIFFSAGATWQRSISSMESNKSVTWGCGVTDSRRLSAHSSHWPTASRRLFILLIKVERLPWRWHQESKALSVPLSSP